MSYLSRVAQTLDDIRSLDRFRSIAGDEVKYVADFSSNDYLALAADSRMVEAMRHVKRVGSGGARLLGGRHREHRLLEEDAARWVAREDALLFSSGYLAAMGAVSVLARYAECIYSDALNHASLIDGIRGTGKPREIYPHLQLPPRSLRRAPALIVSETLFGMDGDVADVAALAADLNDEDILLLDEAHALGVLGLNGSGAAAQTADPRIVVLGTFSKAVGAAGGFIAGPHALIELMVNSARTFIFDTAPPPAIVFAARVGIMLARGADDRRARLLQNVQHVRPGAATPIVPIVLGEETLALDAMRRCAERGVLVPAIRPPTVPPGTSRLRVSVRSDHRAEQMALLAECLGSFACTATS